MCRFQKIKVAMFLCAMKTVEIQFWPIMNLYGTHKIRVLVMLTIQYTQPNL